MNLRITAPATVSRVVSASALALVLVALLAAGCGQSGPSNPTVTYEGLLAQGWQKFEASDFAGAITAFNSAAGLRAGEAEPRLGLGWSHLFLADLAEADAAFTAGSTLAGTDAALADLFAGWAFAANAEKDPAGVDLTNYEDSNGYLAQALGHETLWNFEHVPGLDQVTLLVLRAANHLALGEFAASEVAVQTVDPSFDVDVATAEGRAELAAKIEELTSTVPAARAIVAAAGRGDAFRAPR